MPSFTAQGDRYDHLAIAQEVLALEAKTLSDASKTLDQNFNHAVSAILSTKGKVVVCGVGKSGLVGAKIAATFASTGTPSFFVHPTEALHGDLGMLGGEDLVLAISFSGESEELIRLLPHFDRLGIEVIGMSSNAHSALGKASKVHLDIAIAREACPLDAAPTASTTLTMALGDALAVALMHARDFGKADFASFHPGGKLGKKLFVRAKHVMRTQHLPIVPCGVLLQEALIVMSEGKLGTLVITDEKGLFKGVISDGDLRRLFAKHGATVLDQCVEQVMNDTPKIHHDSTILASEALEIIRSHKIQALFFVDDKGYLQGILHLHDLIEKGI